MPSSSVSLPPMRSTNVSPPAATLKLWFVIPPPSGSTDSTARSGPTIRRTRARRSCADAAPAGSNSGSAATSPATHSPKISTSTGCPGSHASGGQIGVGDRALDRVAVAAARDAASDGAVDAHGLRAERDGARVGEDEAAEAPLRLPRHDESASRPMKSPLSSFTAKPRPASNGRVVGRDVGAPDAVALLEAQRVDRLVARRRRGRGPGPAPRSRPRARARTRSGSRAPSRARRRR